MVVLHGGAECKFPIIKILIIVHCSILQYCKVNAIDSF